MNKLLLEVMPDQIPDYNWHKTVLCLVVFSVPFIPLMIFWSWSLTICIPCCWTNKMRPVITFMNLGVMSEDRHDKSSLIVSSTLGLPGVVGRWRLAVARQTCLSGSMNEIQFRYQSQIRDTISLQTCMRCLRMFGGLNGTRLGKGTCHLWLPGFRWFQMETNQ